MLTMLPDRWHGSREEYMGKRPGTAVAYLSGPMSTLHVTQAVFDRRRFLANVDGNLEVLQEVARLFLEDCPRRLAALDDARTRRDRVALEHAAHTLKGSAGYLSAPGVFRAADKLETIARCGDLADADAACATLQLETRELAEVLSTLC
jgi:two-component system sensor histidine kinase/response regulator